MGAHARVAGLSLRVLRSPAMVEVDSRPFTLESEGVIGTLHRPRTSDPFPAVVLVGGSDGREPVLSAKRLAEEGFATLSIAYFGRPGLPPSLRDVPLEYFQRALDALRQALTPDHGPLVVLGVSRGSEAAFLAGVHFPDLVSAVVGLVPGNVVLCSWPPGGAAWTLNGAALPYVSRFGPIAEDPAAEIPVEKIRGPVLLVSGGADTVWPSTRMAQALASRLRANGHPYPDEHRDLPNAGHWLGASGTRAFPPDRAMPQTDRGAPVTDPETPLTTVIRFLRRVR